jgi:hypothetical protein
VWGGWRSRVAGCGKSPAARASPAHASGVPGQWVVSAWHGAKPRQNSTPRRPSVSGCARRVPVLPPTRQPGDGGVGAWMVPPPRHHPSADQGWLCGQPDTVRTGAPRQSGSRTAGSWLPSSPVIQAGPDPTAAAVRPVEQLGVESMPESGLPFGKNSPVRASRFCCGTVAVERCLRGPPRLRRVRLTVWAGGCGEAGLRRKGAGHRQASCPGLRRRVVRARSESG